jgi:hypothetical protein
VSPQDLVHEAFDAMAAEADRVSWDVGAIAERAWAGGARRRRRSAVRRGVVIAVVVAAVVLLLSPLSHLGSALPAGEGAPKGVAAYPQRIGHQWFVGVEDGLGGPAAGLLEVDGGRGWYVVRPDGGLSSLPTTDMGSPPALSADGRWLAHASTDSKALTVRDLASGTSTTSSRDVVPSPQMPAFWSPDGRLLVSSQLARAEYVVVDHTGAVTQPSLGTGLVAGWLSETEVLVFSTSDARADQRFAPNTVTSTIQLRAVDVATGASRDLPSFRTPRPFAMISQWSLSISPDRSLVAVRDGGTFPGPAELSLFRLVNGEPVTPSGRGATTQDDGRMPLPGGFPACATSWQGDTPVLYFAKEADEGGGRLVASDGSRPVTVIDPHLGATCLELAASALAAGSSWHPFGLQTAWLTWWWREVGVAGAVLVGAVVAYRWRARRKGRLPVARRPRRSLRDWLRMTWHRCNAVQRVALALFGLALVGLVAPNAIPAVADRLGPTDGYPQRISLDWSTVTRARVDGPVVGLLLAKDDTVIGADAVWYLVYPDGSLSPFTGALPAGTVPVLRTDGGSVVYGYRQGTQYVVGRIGGGGVGFPPGDGTAAPLSLEPAPGNGFWSPDGTRLALAGVSGTGHLVYVLNVLGGMQEVVVPGSLTGWLSNDEVVVLTGGEGTGKPLAPVVVDLRADPPLTRQLPSWPGTEGLGAAGRSLSPDGRWVEGPGEGLRESPGEDKSGLAQRTLLDLTEPQRGISDAEIQVKPGCPTQWGPDGPVYTVDPRDGGAPYLAAWVAPGESLVSLDPSLEPQCLILTESALRAGPRWNVFGSSGGWLLHHWHWTLIGVAGLALALLVVFADRDRTT